MLLNSHCKIVFAHKSVCACVWVVCVRVGIILMRFIIGIWFRNEFKQTKKIMEFRRLKENIISNEKYIYLEHNLVIN